MVEAEAEISEGDLGRCPMRASRVLHPLGFPGGVQSSERGCLSWNPDWITHRHVTLGRLLGLSEGNGISKEDWEKQVCAKYLAQEALQS